jgi:hypothetical protein
LKSKVAIEVYNPGGTARLTNVHAPRLDTLSGKTIGEVSNGSWEDSRTFPKIRESLQKRFPDARFVPYTEFPVDSTHIIDVEDIAELVKAKGCDGVIIGNAA